eukprot:Nitzschia sp. Nitz4//scaffold62_size106224//86487//90411//NITZ4_004369-RA/size106224-processed-gene-0.39-mRNA-1//1//CDS//3329555895//9100//frame0
MDRFLQIQKNRILQHDTLPQPDQENPKHRSRMLPSHTFVVCADTQLGMTNNNKDWEVEVEFSKKAVQEINSLSPRPLFCCVCGDLVHMTERIYVGKGYSKEECDAIQDAQVTDFQGIWKDLHQDIALVCLCGNHDVGNRPNKASIERFKNNFGDDYLAFWANGTYNIIVNSCLFADPTDAQDLYIQQLAWLEERLNYATSHKAEHIFVFSHHPWFLYNEDEDETKDVLGSSPLLMPSPEGSGEVEQRIKDSYFLIPKQYRVKVMQLFSKHGVTASFSGHFHQNLVSKASFGMEMIVTGSLSVVLESNGIPKDFIEPKTQGYRIVQVGSAGEPISHKFVSISNVACIVRIKFKRRFQKVMCRTSEGLFTSGKNGIDECTKETCNSNSCIVVSVSAFVKMSLLEPPTDVLKLLRESLPDSVVSSADAEDSNSGTAEILSYVAFLAAGLCEVQDFTPDSWADALTPYLESIGDCGERDVVTKFRESAEMAIMGVDDNDSYGDEDDEAFEEVCNIKFNLAYGGKILLRESKLRLLRGRRYALVGQNGVGKTTLMNAINTGKLEGWPQHLVTAYVDSGSNVDPVHEAKNVMDHLLTDTKRSREDCIAKLKELDFTDAMIDGTIGALSGGWQMKLRLIRAFLIDPDIYLLDEPTNHLAEGAVTWLTNYLNGMEHQTVLTVSHDTTFLENICTDIIHYEQRNVWGPYRRLVHYKGRMSEFVEKQPQAKHYFELSTSEDSLKFVFPNPGRLEGIKTSTQKFLEMEGVDFRYAGRDVNQLTGVDLKMNLSSRIVVLGANGAGKTTLLKMIVGETVPTNLGQCKYYIHPNLRIAYVAQHAFHHVEQHMDESPVAYIQWRFKDGFDKEKLQSESYRITEEEQKAIDDFGLEAIWSRRMRGGQLEYEVKKRNIREKDNKYYTRDELLGMGFEHLIKQTDEKIAAKEAGLDLRPVTTTEIQKHLNDFGLPQEFGTYGKIRGLSGGQKVKLVLAAAFWTVPHLIVMDEPTNFLDREALGALSAALNEWGGAVLMISHNKEFYSSVCKEEWHVANGSVMIQGVSHEREMKAVARKKKFEKELDTDEVLDKAGGNANASVSYKDATINFWGKNVSKKEARNYEKAKKKSDVATMRKILQIPPGKVMPGYEELGDGSGTAAQ